jgi:hypothetical protein
MQSAAIDLTASLKSGCTHLDTAITLANLLLALALGAPTESDRGSMKREAVATFAMLLKQRTRQLETAQKKEAAARSQAGYGVVAGGQGKGEIDHESKCVSTILIQHARLYCIEHGANTTTVTRDKVLGEVQQALTYYPGYELGLLYRASLLRDTDANLALQDINTVIGDSPVSLPQPPAAAAAARKNAAASSSSDHPPPTLHIPAVDTSNPRCRNAAAYLLRGGILLSRGMVREAVTDLKCAATIDPTSDPNLWLTIAHSLLGW